MVRAEGKRYIRTGDVGRFDEDGFLTLMDRKKDMVISGGFNIYPSDLEAVLRSIRPWRMPRWSACRREQWGETPVAFVVPRPAAARPSCALGQRAARQDAAPGGPAYIDELPRSDIGKVLKRELRERHLALHQNGAPAAVRQEDHDLSSPGRP